MKGKVVSLIVIVGSCPVIILLGGTLGHFAKEKLKRMGHLRGWLHRNFGEEWNILQKWILAVKNLSEITIYQQISTFIDGSCRWNTRFSCNGNYSVSKCHFFHWICFSI